MDRRGFLGRMAAAFGLAVVAPKDLLWLPDERAVDLVTPDAITGMTDMTMAVLREIERHMYGTTVPCAEDVPMRFGDGVGPGGPVLNQQLSVDMLAIPWEIEADGIDVDRYLKPLAAQFVSRLRGVKGTGRMLLPTGGVEHACWVKGPSGLSLRGVMAYDIQHDTNLVRFDMLVAQ